MSDTLEDTLDQHVTWVNEAVDLAASEGPAGIKRAIDALEDDQLRGMIFVLVTARAGDYQRAEEAIRDQVARDLLADGEDTVLL